MWPVMGLIKPPPIKNISLISPYIPSDILVLVLFKHWVHFKLTLFIKMCSGTRIMQYDLFWGPQIFYTSHLTVALHTL